MAEREAEAGVIRLSRWIEQPAEKVWQALTDPRILAQWWAPADVKAEVGHRFSLDMGLWGCQRCEVLAVDPGRMLRLNFAPGTLNTTITFRLEPGGGRNPPRSRARRLRPEFAPWKDGLGGHGPRLARGPGPNRWCPPRRAAVLKANLWRGERSAHPPPGPTQGIWCPEVRRVHRRRPESAGHSPSRSHRRPGCGNL